MLIVDFLCSGFLPTFDQHQKQKITWNRYKTELKKK